MEKTNALDNISYNKYTKYFKDKEIGSFLEEFLDKKADKIIEDLNTLYENGDLKGCNDLIKKINDNRAFKIFYKDKKTTLLDIIIKKLLPNFIDSPSDILSFLRKIRFLIPQGYTMDWKFFYTFYYLLYKKNKSEITNYITFFKSLHKFIPQESVSQEDYNQLKKTFLEDILYSNKSYAISTFTYFLPKKYINEDEELQYKLFLLFKNCKNYFVGSCCMFSKIIKNNGKLCFSKNEKENDECIKTFIRYFFTNLNLYIIDDSSVKNQNYTSPTFVSNDNSKKKKKFDHSVIDVLIGLLFNENLKQYSSFIDEHLKIILNNKHLHIKENSNSSIAKNFIKFINDFVHRMYNIFHGKKYEEEINKKIVETSLIEYKKNEYLFNRLLNIVKYFNICFKKIFLYENEDTFGTLQKLFNTLGTIEASDDYMDQLLKNIDFDEYLNILNFFKDNIETKSIKFINKLQTILPLLLSKYVYKKYNKVKEFIKDIISITSSSINSANISFDINILVMFGTYFYDIKNKIKKSNIYESLIPLIEDATMTIMNNIIGFLDLICLRNNSEFSVFISSMKHFLDEEKQKKISKKYANYIEDNEIESKYLIYYFNVIDEEEHSQIFKYIFNNMIYVDNSNDTKINEYFLYPEKDEELKINMKYCSLEIIEKLVQKYKSIFSLLNFSKILNNEKDIKKFYQIYFTLINREETSFKRLGIELFNSVLNSLLNCKIKAQNLITDENDLIEYPSKENIQLINNIYKKIVLPYEKYIVEYMKENKKENVSKKIEQIIYIYIMLIQSISLTRLNIILMLNEEDPSLKEYKSIQCQIDMYKEYKNLINNSLNVIKQIHEYNSNSNNEHKLFSNQNTISSYDQIILNKLSMDSQNMTDKRTKLREKKSFLYKYFNLNDIKHFWLKKKITVMNYNYFSLMKNFVPKDDFYYTCLYIYSQNLSAVNHASNTVGICKNYMYALNKDKIKELYNNIYSFYEKTLSNIKEESETEKNIMKNISGIFLELSFLYISLFPLDMIQVIIKVIVIINLLKVKKYTNIDKSIGMILFRIRSIVHLPICSEKKYKKLFNKYSGKNDIIINEIQKIIINDKIKEYNNNYNNIIRNIFDMLLKGMSGINIFTTNFLNFFKEKKIEETMGNNIINDKEKILLFFRLKDYILEIFGKNEESYKKVVEFILNTIFSKFVPISFKYFWLKILHIFLKEEYNHYKEYQWLKFKTDEDFNNNYNKLKYDLKGKKKNEILPVRVQSIRLTKFNGNDSLNDNIKYNIDIKNYIEIIKEINEWIEEQSLIENNNNKFFNQEFMSKMLGFNKDNKGLDFKRVKILYYMMELKYIDFDKNDYIKNYKFDEKEDKKNITVVLELLVAKYYYMINKGTFTEDLRKEFWDVMKYYTNGGNKKEDEKIISFFNFFFTNCSLNSIIFIFKDSHYYEYPIDFVSKLYNLYLNSFSKFKNEQNIFNKEETNKLINNIISNDGNLILYSNELKNIMKLYFEINQYLKYDYYSFEDKYTEDIINYFNDLISKNVSKRSRYALYEIYSHFFYCLNDDLTLFNSIMPLIAKCINEFKTHDIVDLGTNMLTTIEGKFRNYNKEINLKNICDKVAEILKKEENSNDTNKLLYLQTINIVYNGQKHFNLDKLSSNDIFKCLYKVFDAIKNEDLKSKFSSIFVSHFNDLTEEENNKFIKEYQDIALKTNDEEKGNNNYIYLLMSQLLRFRVYLPDYIQEFIISLKNIYKKKKYAKGIIDSFLKIAMDNYHGAYIYMKNNISENCRDILEEMTKEKSYFV